jgi:hypothetical protein
MFADRQAIIWKKFGIPDIFEWMHSKDYTSDLEVKSSLTLSPSSSCSSCPPHFTTTSQTMFHFPHFTPIPTLFDLTLCINIP